MTLCWNYYSFFLQHCKNVLIILIFIYNVILNSNAFLRLGGPGGLYQFRRVVCIRVVIAEENN